MNSIHYWLYLFIDNSFHGASISVRIIDIKANNDNQAIERAKRASKLIADNTKMSLKKDYRRSYDTIWERPRPQRMEENNG